jgi:hypothetical protein
MDESRSVEQLGALVPEYLRNVSNLLLFTLDLAVVAMVNVVL